MGGVSTFLLKIYVVIYMDESRVIYCVPTVYPELTWFDLNLLIYQLCFYSTVSSWALFT